MERGIRRNARCAPRLELPPQDRHDLGAQDVHLLKHGRERQAGMIGEEQLPLVVADHLAEAERPVDDLLWTADRHRRHRHVVL